jgi:hypothetical protein
MKRTTTNFIIDTLSFVVLIVLSVTGYIIKFILPPGSGGHGPGHGGGRNATGPIELAGWSRHDYGDLHFYFALAFVALMLIHIIIHWSWIKAYFKSYCTISE